MSPRRESEAAARVRRMLEEIVGAVDVDAAIEVSEDEVGVHANLDGEDLGLLIGRHGQTIDAIQYLANAIRHRAFPDEERDVVIDAAGYRERRRATLEQIAVRCAERVVGDGDPVELEPMTAIERKVVHLRLKEFPGVETSSEGTEPNRFIVVSPVRE